MNARIATETPSAPPTTTSPSPPTVSQRKESQMIEKTPRSAASREASAMAPWNGRTDIYRQQMALMASAASSIFRSMESMRKVQQHAAHQGNLHYSAAAARLSGSCEPAELSAIQSELIRFDAQEACRYWQQMTAAILQAQIECMSAANHLFDQESGSGMKSAFDAFQQVMPMAAPFFASHSNGHASHARAA